MFYLNVKETLKDFFVFIIAILAGIAFAIITGIIGNVSLALSELAAITAIVLLAIVSIGVVHRRKKLLIHHITADIDFASGKVKGNFPLPVLVTDEKGKILWYNKLLEDSVIGSDGHGYPQLEELCNEDSIHILSDAASTGVRIECDDKSYTVYSNISADNEIVMYFADNTKYHKIAQEYKNSRPAIIIVAIDSMDELNKEYRESDCAAIRNGIEKLVEDWISDFSSLITKISDTRFLIVTESKNVDIMIEKKFDILDKVRNYEYNGKRLNVTLSIGIGRENTYAESENTARQALDMAFGRGGDQAAVKAKETYSFYGGVSRSIEKSGTVKSRIVASALADVISGSENVIVMGHKYPDLDALGAAVGICTIAEAMGKKAVIATDIATSLSKPMIEQIVYAGRDDLLVPVSKALSLLKKKTLLVIVDTHVKGFVESKELLDKANMKVVVDHHRKSVDFINDSVIFFHDSSASSACEMVTELIRYIPSKIKPGKLVADALLAGIMLDTKNFVLRTGVKTFEAAAYLKGLGADTVKVKEMFADTMNSYQLRNKVIDKAVEYKNCAISYADINSPDIRIISAQAADELLNIKGIDASFVFFKMNDDINISARSFGKINVQIIMEQIGGGGHQTMAAAQIHNSDERNAVTVIKNIIDNYYNNSIQ